ncbi:MAG: hypothetical protein H0W50_08470 [Parachlamydiaceae bacterium]|nr:hypothetical protein [Parachlamydiaceae bacterium]
MIDKCQFDIPAQNLAKVANALHQRFPDLIDPSIEQIIQNSKPEGELKGCIQLKNSPENQTFRLELAQGKYWWLGREHDVSNFTFEKDLQNIKAVLKYKIEDHPCWLFMKSEGQTLARGQVILSDKYTDLLASPDISRSVIVEWVRTPQGFDIQKAFGNFAGLTVDLVKSPSPLRASTESFPLRGRVAVALDQAYNIMTPNVKELLNTWKVEKNFNFVGQWQINRNPKNGFFSFQGNMTGQNIHFNGYKLDLLQADCTYSSDKIELNNLIVQDPAGSLEVNSIKCELNAEGRRALSMGRCHVTNWHPSLMRGVGQPQKPASQLVVNQLKIEQLKGYVDDPNGITAKGELTFNKHTRRISHNPLIVIPTEIITRIGLDPATLTPFSGGLYFDIQGNKIVFTKFKDIYSEGRMSKFNLAKTSSPSYMDFDGKLNLKIRMKHYNLLFKLGELFTFNVKGTFQKPEYSIRKQSRKGKSFAKK